MRKFILDTSVLIQHWKKCAGNSLKGKKPADAAKWGQDLIQIEDTNAILTPIYVEMVAGVGNDLELDLAQSFLGQFNIVDKGQILRQDWDEARRLAEKIPRDSKPRQLGDCLIQAIANRLKYQVRTFDKRFPR